MGELLKANLTEGERLLLISGLREWGGPAKPTPELAKLMGFADSSTTGLDDEETIRLLREVQRKLARVARRH